MHLLKCLAAICCILASWAYFKIPSGSGDVASRQTLSVSEQPDRIVLGWSGPVQEPMSERVAAALDRYKADRRRIVLILNSPGGSIEHGRVVVAAIRDRNRAIDTVVQKAGVCASMCVPIFLAGAKRIADPESYFMFHEASLRSTAPQKTKRPGFSEPERVAFEEVTKVIAASATDELFQSDMGIRGVNASWLDGMRKKIRGRDVWISGQQLVDERSGIVDSLIRTAAR